ncbi:YczE/YyaS/YitT family protein [Bacillus sp. JJ1562]|uniref:YczE/YyaS/YitT family protein n=1 Tax=Bacillus sp. JJ1562 TaxID=3122960 RepID=UPI0030010AF0
MNHINVTMKRLGLYIIGLLFLSLGVSFSIQADLGVSPVSSLAYAFALTSGLSVGTMTVVANVLFIFIQVILSKRFNMRESIVQLIISFLFGFFMDLTLFLVQLLPAPETLIMRWAFLLISLFVVAIGLLGYFTTKFPLMPYDELTFVISEKYKKELSKAKISSDLLNVCVAGLVCIIFIQSLGAVGIGTVVAAYFIGKILGWLMKHYQKYLTQWIYINKEEPSQDIEAVQKENTSLSS